MNPKRSPWHYPLRFALTVFLFAALLLSAGPCSSARAVELSNWADSSNEMLAPGNHVEGEAIVALLRSEEGTLQARVRPLEIDDPTVLLSVLYPIVGCAIVVLVAGVGLYRKNRN